MIGSIIDGKYHIRRLLGEGAMGSVYEAEHAGTGRRCAVKVISSADLTRDPKVVSRFQREARAAGAIDTQHITQVLDAGVDRESSLPFLAMEYLAGEDLNALIKRVGPLAPELALRIVAQACLGLQKAHDANVVHRDIKPHNLFLARRDAGEVIIKLLDFGIAKVKMDQANETEGAELTRTGNLLGSPLYMSPEQARGQKEIDHRTDIWSMGAVLYQALTARTPYHHITALGQLIIAICQEPAPSVQEHAPWIPAEVAAIVHRCLKQDPAQRYQSAGELFQAIRPLLPYGWGIHEDMLVPLQESMKQQSAPRFMPSLPPTAMQSGAHLAMSPPAGGLQTAEQRPPMPSHVGAATTAALSSSQSQNIPRPPSKVVPVVVGAALLTLALGGGGVYFLTRTPDEPVVTTPPVAPPVAAEPAPTPSVAPAPTPDVTAAVDAPVRTLSVLVRPRDATVEIDKKVVTVGAYDFRTGVIDISGPVNSKRIVRLSKGKDATEIEVTIGSAGPIPPIVELTLTGAAKSSAAPATGPATAPTPPKPGIIETTDEFGTKKQ